jgi:small-conductance mechanosensitive channel
VDVREGGLPLLVVGVVLAAGVAAWIVGRVIARIGRRPRLRVLATAHRLAHRPWLATVTSGAALVVIQDRTDVADAWRRVATIAVIASTCWLVVAVLRAVERAVTARLPMQEHDNRRARRARTQLVLLRRIATAVVVVLGIGACLLTFPSLRTFGTSLLASAGIVGIIGGLAAQALLGNVIAGLQLAFTDALRVDDVVVAEGEWGRVEDITLTYVVVALWDERRLVLPTTYFTTTPFQNWTRTESRVLGATVLHLDHRTPVDALRRKAQEVITASPLWDQRDWVVQVVDTTETTMVVRVLASAYDAPTSWDLQCDIREELIAWLRDTHPEALPARRVDVTLEPGVSPGDGRPGNAGSPRRRTSRGAPGPG